jgi:hypothetical protein
MSNFFPGKSVIYHPSGCCCVHCENLRKLTKPVDGDNGARFSNAHETHGPNTGFRQTHAIPEPPPGIDGKDLPADSQHPPSIVFSKSIEDVVTRIIFPSSAHRIVMVVDANGHDVRVYNRQTLAEHLGRELRKEGL